MANQQQVVGKTTEVASVGHRDDGVPIGTAVIRSDAIQNPGFEPFRPRVTDLDPLVERQQERRVSAWFVLSIIGTVLTIVAYIAFPIIPGNLESVRLNNLLLGIGITLSLMSIGFGAVHW